ncbi:stage III sporulation protein AH [Clostridium tetanomorphum]|uniref:SpoIIIAH-like family protein n=1 Tax=Clostridium tetanomorphum TaxID=1553 RepID=A0A923E7N2_CLOTT|nr:SpoIIIAH-like family protein [Clostridium tetanomorphum]KAJ51481.1 stage III sporulation protein AH [Clostridium tetanomorphum DSM 665]MBC2396574.1 SpoIIIAH-like family protein [Clostridium tetanomorphum]MBP1863902.1 stage III sporulation protein AH [Clostridium tetanomorphum]NRS84980.1 stage III sporulation protein AH [Clostridium tetanomorphum]NRZ98196.1 stage III sporulation protein AH [Clostridium tetanomorphum]
MNKKQAVIIVTLLALIVCMGLLATRLNNPLYVQGEGEKSAISLKNNDNKKNSNSSNYFAEAKMSRDNRNAQTLQSLKSIMEDKNISQQQRDKTAEKYAALAMAVNYENKIELNLQAKGYDDVVCLLNENKATITVKSSEKLTDKQLKEIQSVVMNETKIKDVEIQTK